MFKGLSVAEKCFIPESVPLNIEIHTLRIPLKSFAAKNYVFSRPLFYLSDPSQHLID